MSTQPLIAKSATPTSTSTERPFLWADCVPLTWKPYIQLTRIDLFGGTLMIFWPFAWTLAFIHKDVITHFDLYISQVATWLVWSVLLHSVGSTWNDIIDMDIDRQVERTKNRPLPSGTISVRAAILWMCPQVGILLALLTQFSQFTFLMGMVQLFFFTTIYPYTKRYIHIPQVWLGITIAWGATISWAANAEKIYWPGLGVMLTVITTWVTYMDTLYAMLDRKDDPKAGVKSTALFFGAYSRHFLVFLAALFVFGMASIGFLMKATVPFFIISVLGPCVHFTWQLFTVDLDDGESCMTMFDRNLKVLGAMTLVGILFS